MSNKYTTKALQDNQHLIIQRILIVEAYCKGYTDGKRDKKLDGFYLRSELNTKR